MCHLHARQYPLPPKNLTPDACFYAAPCENPTNLLCALSSKPPAGLLEDLQEVMTKDPDAQVVANCMSVLQQVCQRRERLEY